MYYNKVTWTVDNGQWEPAPTQTASTAPNIACIFDAIAVNTSDQCPSPSLISVHPDQPNYSLRQYWWLLKSTLSGILSAVVLHVLLSPSTADDELEMVKVLHSILTLRKRYNVSTGLSGDRSTGPSGDYGRGERNRDKGGCRGGCKGECKEQGTFQKRVAEEDDHTHSSNKWSHVHSFNT